MWLNFHAKSYMCVVRVFIGHVNVVSGLTMEETCDKKLDEGEQDYIVLPDQKWLDGICIAPGIVRQFVAMPRMCFNSFFKRPDGSGSTNLTQLALATP